MLSDEKYHYWNNQNSRLKRRQIDLEATRVRQARGLKLFEGYSLVGNAFKGAIIAVGGPAGIPLTAVIIMAFDTPKYGIEMAIEKTDIDISENIPLLKVSESQLQNDFEQLMTSVESAPNEQKREAAKEKLRNRHIDRYIHDRAEQAYERMMQENTFEKLRDDVHPRLPSNQRYA